MLFAWRGEREPLQAITDELSDTIERGEGLSLALLLTVTALLHNGNGRYGDALAAAQQACEHEDVVAYGLALVELIEAGVRVGRPGVARPALDRLIERTQASGTDWALGIETASSGSRAAAAWSTSPVPGCSTANGCVVRTAESTRASNFEQPTRCSAALGRPGLPSAHVTSSWQRVRRCGGALTTGGACSPRRRLTLPGLHETAFRTPRSALNCSSVLVRCVPEARDHLSQPAEPAPRQQPRPVVTSATG